MARFVWPIPGNVFLRKRGAGGARTGGNARRLAGLSYDLMVDGAQKPLADARYLLSPGDLCTVPQVPEIVAAGVGGLKIEGRYKDADYVALTTHAYREAVDRAWGGVAADAAEMAAEILAAGTGLFARAGAVVCFGDESSDCGAGRAPRHRGVCMGRVVSVDFDRVVIAAERGRPAASASLKPGDGVVFDAADWRSPGEPEEGGRVYEVIAARPESGSHVCQWGDSVRSGAGGRYFVADG